MENKENDKVESGEIKVTFRINRTVIEDFMKRRNVPDVVQISDFDGREFDLSEYQDSATENILLHLCGKRLIDISKEMLNGTWKNR